MADLTVIRGAFAAQSEVLIAWADALSGDALAAPSALEGWTVGQLIGHLAISASRIPELAAKPTSDAPLSLADYVAQYRPAADEIAAHVQTIEGDQRAALRTSTDAALAAIDAGVPDVVLGPRGPIRGPDAVLTRVIELVVHSQDLGAPLERSALELVVRTFTTMLADQAPGRSVELRVPPFSAVQIIEGQTHRRGTPPATVEVKPEDWVRLATGRIAWADAAEDGTVRASGVRSDLSPYLPLLS